VSELLGSVRKLGGFDTALTDGFGFSTKEFDGMVRNYIVDRYRFIFFFSDSWLFWTAGALLAVAGFIAVKVRNNKRKRQMEEEERTAIADEKEKLKKISLDEVLDDFGEDKD
jgi:hypothetical protein